MCLNLLFIDLCITGMFNSMGEWFLARHGFCSGKYRLILLSIRRLRCVFEVAHVIIAGP